MRGAPVFPSFKPTCQGSVVMLSGEDPPNLTLQRLHALARESGISDNDFAETCQKHLLLRSLKSEPLMGITQAAGGATYAPLASMEILKNQCRNRGVKLIVLDTLRKYGGLPENDNGAMGALMTELARLATQVDAALLVLHHASKQSTNTRASLDQWQIRGASAITDESRSVLFLERKGRIVYCLNAKNNFAETLPKCAFENRGRALVEVTTEYSDREIGNAIYSWFLMNGGKQVTLGGIGVRAKGGACELVDHILEDHPTLSTRQVQAATQALVKEGLLEEYEGRTSDRRKARWLRVAHPENGDE